jgi:DNA-binding NarL/FixJ family response regulator
MKGRGKQSKERRKRRVLIVDDHAVLREGLAMVINHQPDLLVCGEAEDVPSGLQAVATSRPDVVIVDLSLGSGSGLDLIKDIKAQHPDLAMLVLSLHDETLYAERVLRAGARGYIMKRASTTEVLEALRKVLHGEVYLSQKMAALATAWKTGTPPPNQPRAGGGAQPSA